jgi:hypothetical protein
MPTSVPLILATSLRDMWHCESFSVNFRSTVSR